MYGIRLPGKRSGKDEAEKPFWITFSDMMTALMVLFLVSMTVALLAITQKMSTTKNREADRENEIVQLMNRIRVAVERDFPGVVVKARSVDFGDQARFASNSHMLSPEQGRTLRAFVPKVLDIARDPLGEKWLKRVIVEGYADQRGSYMHNLNLSLQRSERVLCLLLAGPDDVSGPLTEADRLLVRDLFIVGGASFNSLKGSMEESRRIELRLEFLDLDEKRPTPGTGMLDDDTRCPLD